MNMNIFTNNIIGTVISLFAVGGLALGAGAIVSHQIDVAAKQNQQPSVTISATPTAIPVITPSKQAIVKGAKITQPTINSDPIINCIYPHSGTVRITQSECARTKLDCEVEPGKWQVVWKTDCDALYAKRTQPVNTQKPIGHRASPTILPTHTPYVPEKTIACTTSTGTYQVTQDLCNDFKASDEKLLQDAKEREAKSEQDTYIYGIEIATAAYERCIKDAEKFYEQGMMQATSLDQQYGSGSYPGNASRSETVTQYNRLKQRCEQNYPLL